MDFFHRLNIYGSKEAGTKKELFIVSDAIDFLSWYKQEKPDKVEEGTRLHNVGNDTPFILVEGLPDIINNGAFDGLFFKCTAHRAVEGGIMKKYSVWINPDNITHFQQTIPGSTLFVFRSGAVLAIANDVDNVRKALIEHNKKYRERIKAQYVKPREAKQETGF
jgi:hypothetical protein